MNNIDFKKIGNFINGLRIERNLTLEQFGKYIGVTKPAVSQWVNGKGIKPEYLYSIARFFNITVDELIAGKRNDESNNDYIKRNYDLSLYEFDDENHDDKSGEIYFSHLNQIKNRFFDLLPKWASEELNSNSKEEFEFLKQYFDEDRNYISYLKYGQRQVWFRNDKDIKDCIKNKLQTLESPTDEETKWELQKFYNVKKDYLKIDLVCNTQSNYLLKKLINVLNQVEKDIFLAINLEIEETKTSNNIFRDYEYKQKRKLTFTEIENNSYIKTMLNGGCNCMKEYQLYNYLDEEDFKYLEGNPIGQREGISLDMDTRPYMKDARNKNLVGSLSKWKIYTYGQYMSFVDKRKTAYLKALVNYKDNNPIKYYEALQNYYGGKEVE